MERSRCLYIVKKTAYAKQMSSSSEAMGMDVGQEYIMLYSY